MMASPSEGRRKFPDYVAPTKINYDGAHPKSIQVRTCRLVTTHTGVRREFTFDQAEVRIGAMDDNDLCVPDETVSRFHCRIVQDDNGYLLIDGDDKGNRSTNGTFVNGVRVREAYLSSGCTVSLGQTDILFNATQEKVEIIPSSKTRLADIIGRHVKMRELYAVIEKIAPTGATVVIEGETGTGKEVVAQTIHRLSPRAPNSMMVFDCGAVPKNLIESELFGHEKGSFTGAIMTRQGLFEMAHGSTLFLDEIGELPLELQPKLLRALEQREVRRVGGTRPIKVDVRIIAATNRDLEEEVRAGRFRQDLFYRLSVVRLFLPPLRERTEDIPLLCEAFLADHAYNRLPDGRRKCQRIAPQAMELLQSYRWPGNVRELVNAMERAVSFAGSEVIEARDLPETILLGEAGPPFGAQRGKAQAPAGPSGPEPSAPVAVRGPESSLPQVLPQLDLPFKDAKEMWVASFEREYIAHLLRKNRSNISHAARAAEIDRKYFRKLMRKYAIEVPGEGPDDDE